MMTTITRSTPSPLVSNFITNSMVCMSNGLHNKQLCYTIFRKSCSILNLDAKQFAEFSQLLDTIEIGIDIVKIETYADFFTNNLQKLATLWKSYFPHYATLIIDGKKIIEKDQVASWPITDATFIWSWLHIISIDIDLHCGTEEKRAFLNFIPEIIACPICKNHYLQNLNGLNKSLERTTCANAILALHTHVNATINTEDYQTKFVFDKKLVNLFYSKKYKTDYLRLKINS